MYTEDEAKGKWCPDARLVAVEGQDNEVANRTAYNKCMHVPDGREFIPNGAACIASDCMEWRWSGHTMLRILDSIPYNDSEVEQFMKMRKRLKDSIKDGSVSDPERGYCGLGGAPRG